MGFTRDDVEALSASFSEPGWVLERRLEAWDLFAKMELPREKDEPWRYTDLRRMRFSFDGFTPARPGTRLDMLPEAQALLREEGARAGYVIQRDADVVFTELDPGLASRGVILTDLHTAIAQHPELVREHLFAEVRPDENVFTALHGALFCGGTFLYVPKGVEVALPVESQRWIDEPGSAIFPHTLIVVEEGAELVYLERFQSPDLSGAALSNGAAELVAGPGSRVSFVSLQEFGAGVWHLQTQRAISAREVTLRSIVVMLGARFSRAQVDSVIRGERSSSEMLGLYFAESNQHFDMRTLQDHVAGYSTSDLLYKGALKDASRTVYSGLIRVNRGAVKTDAYQANRNLVLSDDAKADSKPELEILNNDVRCTHGSTVGQMAEEELFYLQSRGISRADAERLIVFGFFEEVINRMRVEEVRRVLYDAIARKLGGAE